MPEVVDNNITQWQFKNISSPYALDLISLFSLLEEKVQKTISLAIEDGWTPDRLIQEISNLI